MTREEYLAALRKKGYTIINNDQVSKANVLYNVCEEDVNTAMGIQHTCYLKFAIKK